MRNFKLFAILLAGFLLIGCSSEKQTTEFQSVEDIETARIGLVLGTTHDFYGKIFLVNISL